MNGGLSRDKDTHFTVIDERDKAEDKGLTARPDNCAVLLTCTRNAPDLLLRNE